jgi:hypothetical protein
MQNKYNTWGGWGGPDWEIRHKIQTKIQPAAGAHFKNTK